MANELLKLIPIFRDGDSRLLVWRPTRCATSTTPSRGRPVRLPAPGRSARPDRPDGIWKRYVARSRTPTSTVGELAERSQFFSAADIGFAASKAAQAAFERSLGGEHAPATTGDFVAAIAEARPSVTAVMAREFDEDIDRFARF